jgi:hypothetical protein
MPDPVDKEACYEPLERMRVVTDNLFKYMDLYCSTGSWQHCFSAFQLPNALSGKKRASRSSDAALQEKVKGLLEKLFTTAGFNPGAALQQFLRLLPSAESHFSQGACEKDAWCRASSEFPELELGRAAVSLYVVCMHTTGNIERSLKDVAAQHTAGRGSMLGCTLDDIMQVNLHSPPFETIASQFVCASGKREIAPQGSYLPYVLKAYKESFSGRAWRRSPKKRRDVGLKRNVDRLAEKRSQRGAPEPESVRLMVRDAEVDRECGKNRGQLKRSYVGGPIPKQTDAYVTDSVAAKRAKLDEMAVSRRSTECLPTRLEAKPSAVKLQSEQRWGHAKNDGVDILGRPARKGSQPMLFCPQALANESAVLLLSRRGWTPCHDWKALPATLRANKAAMFITASIFDNTLHADPIAIFCQVVGGYLTSSQWLAQSVVESKTVSRPRGFGFSGLLRKDCVLCWGPRVVSTPALKTVVDALGNLCKDSACKMKIADSVTDMKRHFKRHLKKHGDKAKPWKRCHIIALDVVEAKSLRQSVGDKYQNMVVDLPSFLRLHGNTKSSSVCPGQW